MEIRKKAFRKQTEMKPTFIVKCTRCQGLMLTTRKQKTKSCPYCGVHVDLLCAQKVASASNPFEASTMLRKLKSEQGFLSKKP